MERDPLCPTEIIYCLRVASFNVHDTGVEGKKKSSKRTLREEDMTLLEYKISMLKVVKL